MRHLLTATIGVLLAAWAAPAGAQTAPVTSATSLAITGGLSHADDATRPTLGGTVRWELTPHLAVEGAGRWMDRRRHPDAYAAELAIVAGLSGTRETAVPYLLAGIGLQRRSFDLGAGAPAAPGFYARRVTATASAAGNRETFTDPTAVAGFGVDVPIGHLFTIRPDLRALVVFGGGRRDTVVLATVSLGRRFEHKPVTPVRR